MEHINSFRIAIFASCFFLAACGSFRFCFAWDFKVSLTCELKKNTNFFALDSFFRSVSLHPKTCALPLNKLCASLAVYPLDATLLKFTLLWTLIYIFHFCPLNFYHTSAPSALPSFVPLSSRIFSLAEKSKKLTVKKIITIRKFKNYKSLRKVAVKALNHTHINISLLCEFAFKC